MRADQARQLCPGLVTTWRLLLLPGPARQLHMASTLARGAFTPRPLLGCLRVAMACTAREAPTFLHNLDVEFLRAGACVTEFQT